MVRKLFAVVLAMLLLTGCVNLRQEPDQLTQYNASFLTLFDTVTTIVGRYPSEKEFSEVTQAIHDELLEYHQLFDIYNDYDGLNNLKTINDNAGIGPVEVDSRIIDLLLDCKAYYELSGGKVNVAMGSVLNLWHVARNDSIDDPANGYTPDPDALKEAAEHGSFDTILIDEAAGTVFITDPHQRLDVGAVAKGWSIQRVAEKAPSGLLMSVGGNVFATGPKDASGTPWVVGVTNPDGGNYLHTLNTPYGAVVTSGDYQRFYQVDGVTYHHIIDPVTLFPSNYWRSVTIVCDDSGLADTLSTALFLLPQAEGQALLDACGAEALWMDLEGTLHYSTNFKTLIRT